MRKASDRCDATGKVRYRDSKEAVRALHQAARARHFAALDGGASRRAERRHYECGSCQGWHLTSREHAGELRPVAVRPPIGLDPFVRSLRSAISA